MLNNFNSLLFRISLFGLLVSSCGSEPEQPNILFIVVDDLRPELNCYGQSQIHSPNIDALAEEGLLFQNAYCNVPVCGASRASLMTGLRPTQNRFLNYLTRADKDAPGIITLPGYFRDHGYVTISNGKIFHHSADSKESWDEIWRPEIVSTGRDYRLPENIALDTIPEKRGAAWEKFEGADDIYFDGKIALKSIRDLQKLKDGDAPFFLAVGFLKPHLPFNAPAKYWDLYEADEIVLPGNDSLPEGVPSNLISNWGELRNYDGIPAEGPVSETIARKLIHGYYACVSYTDAQIGLLMDALRELDLERNTIVILWGDHGWNLREHGLWCKHSNFDTSTRSALLLKVPGRTRGEKCDVLVEYIDIYPTLVDLCGLPLPVHLEGSSMYPLLRDPDTPINDYIIAKWQGGLTIKTEKYAYTEWATKEDSVIGKMLYDHQFDRDENFNLAVQPEFGGLMDSLSLLMHAKN